MISENYLRWLGGFFDGEGSVSLAYTPNGRKDGSKTFRLQVTLSQNNRTVLEELVSLFGGRLSRTGQYKCSAWTIQCAAAGRFLDTILPYVRLKSSVIKLALIYRALVDSHVTKGRNRGYGENLPVLLYIRNEIRRINALD